MSDFTLELALPTPVILELTAAQGPAGPPGAGGEQLDFPVSVAAAVWTVNHNFGFRPNVQVLSPGGKEMIAEILHVSVNQVTITFDEPQTGSAICS